MTHVDTLLHELTSLAHEFGTPRFVKGDSGSISAKTGETLWIKPTGRRLQDLRPALFVALSRERLARFPREAFARDPDGPDHAVRAFTAEAVLPHSPGRPSVEATIHDALPPMYWVRFFPSPALGLVCAARGREACAELFPNALWVPYANPGLALSVAVRDALAARMEVKDRPPKLVFLEHHGLYVGDETPAGLRARVARTLETLERAIDRAAVPLELAIGPEPSPEAVGAAHDKLLAALPDGGGAVVLPSGPFRTAGGPLIPEHVIHAGGFALDHLPTAEELAAFAAEHGAPPRVFSTPGGVYAAGSVFKEALLTLEFAREMALVEQYTAAFGGAVYLDDDAVAFIRQWNKGREVRPAPAAND